MLGECTLTSFNTHYIYFHASHENLFDLVFFAVKRWLSNIMGECTVQLLK